MATGKIADPMTLTALLAGYIPPGTTIHLRAGTYTGNYNISQSGKSGKPITFVPYNNEPVKIAGACRLTGNYITLQNIEVYDPVLAAGRTSYLDASVPTDLAYTEWALIHNYGVGNAVITVSCTMG
jgi:hypothetical protein